MKLLEEKLRQNGFVSGSVVRPTLQAVHAPEPGMAPELIFKQAMGELDALLGSRVPHLTIGFSFGGLLAGFNTAPLRMAVCSPWGRLPSEALVRLGQRPGLLVLQGGADTVVVPPEHLPALPQGIPITLDPEGTHNFDAWMDRIAIWIQAGWREYAGE